MKKNDLLESERSYSGAVNAIIIAVSLTGFATFFVKGFHIWEQWTVLGHMLLGCALSLILVPYLYLHFRRTQAFRRAGLLFSGIVLALLFIACALTGWQMALIGLREDAEWIYTLHAIASTSFVLIIVLHVFLHVAFLPEHRKKSSAGTFPSIKANMWKHAAVSNLCIQGLIFAATFTYMAIYTGNQIAEAAIQPYQTPYGEHPFRPSQTETSHGGFVHESDIANSQKCIECHKDIGEQWLSSAHQQAAADPTYVTNITLLAEKKGIEATRYCEGCHAPVALLTGQLTEGGEHGGISGTPANTHGISCMSCHGVKNIPHIKGVASYEFTPAQAYLFSDTDSPWLAEVNSRLIELSPTQHKNDVGHDIISDPKSCAACHTQFMDKDLNDWGWIQMQNDYGAWLNSPYSGQHEQNFSESEKVRCQDCHMPLVKSNDPSADKNGMVRSHHFAAANTFLPLLRGDKKQFEAVKAFLQEDKIRVSIDKPSRSDLVQSTSFMNEDLRDSSEASMFYYLGEEANISVVVSNQGVGHNFPAGTIDINQAWIDFSVTDSAGREVFRSGAISKDGYVDKDAYFYRSKPIDRHGQLVWKHDLFNMVGSSFKRVIPAGESDVANYQFTVPSWAKSPLTIVATVRYRKLNNDYAKWALKDKYFDIPPIDMGWDSLSLPVKLRKEVEQLESRVSSD